MALAAHKFWRNLLGKPKTAVSYGIRKVFAVMLTFHLFVSVGYSSVTVLLKHQSR